ncbi:MAG: cytochrome P450, partial [Acidimicrobiales bacterium]
MAMPSGVTTSTPDLLSPAFYADIDGMQRTLTELRAAGPVWRDEANSLWAVLGHDEIIDVEARADVFCSGAGFRAGLMPEGSEQDMIALDDPAHAAQRRLVARRFTPKAVRAHHASLDRLMDGLIDGFVDRGSVELIDELAAPLPSCATATLLGYPESDAGTMRSWSERLMRRDEILNDPGILAEFMGAVMEIAQSVGEIVPQRRDDPRDDLLSVWTNRPTSCTMVSWLTGQPSSSAFDHTDSRSSRGSPRRCGTSSPTDCAISITAPMNSARMPGSLRISSRRIRRSDHD